MKNIIKLSILSNMKLLQFILITIISVQYIYCQTNPETLPDSFLVVTKYNYEIINGSPTDNKRAEIQKTFNKQNQLVRSIQFSFDTYQPISFTYYHYNNENLICKEYIDNNNKLLAVVTINYKKGEISSIDSILNKPKHKIKYKYKNNQTSKKYYNTSNKFYKIIDETWSNNHLVESTTKYLSNIDTATKTTSFIYDDNSKIIEKKTELNLKSGQTLQLSEQFHYTKNNIDHVDLYINNKLEQVSKQKYSSRHGNIVSNNTTDGNKFYFSSILYEYRITDLVIPKRSLPTGIK